MGRALVSVVGGRRVGPGVAMTGELSLGGGVLAVGGIKEKVLGAKRAGIHEVILPADNQPNVVEDLPEHLLEGMKIHYAHTLDEALEHALSKEKVLPMPLPKSEHAQRLPSSRVPPGHSEKFC